MTANRTVVAWDGSDACRTATDWAIERALHDDRRAEFVLVHVIDESTYRGGDPADPGSYDDRTAPPTGEDVAGVRHRLPNASVSARSVIGDPLSTLREHTDRETLLVTGAPVGPRLTLAHTIGAQLAATAFGPVAVVPSHVTSVRSGVVAGVDGSEAAIFAATEAQRRAVGLRLVHAWLEPPVWLDTPVFTDESIDEQFMAELRRQHQQIADETAAAVRAARPLVAVTAEAVHGHAAVSLLGASPLPELVVVGRRQHPAHGAHLLGSTSHEVVVNLDVPVIVVPEDLPDHKATPRRELGLPHHQDHDDNQQHGNRA